MVMESIDDALTFGGCLEITDRLKGNMENLDNLRVYIEGQENGTKLFLKYGSESDKYIIFHNGELEMDPDSLRDEPVRYLHIQEERSYGVFGRRILGDITLEKQGAGYVLDIRSGKGEKDRLLPALERLAENQERQYSPSA